jgi:hypothetical protein
MSELTDIIVPSKLHHALHELAWQPDLIEAFGVQRLTGRLDHFHPIEPDIGVRFIECGDIVAHIISGGRGTGKSTLLYYRIKNIKQKARTQLLREVPPYVFFLRPSSVLVSRDALILFSNINVWCAAWRLIFGLVFAYSIKRRRPVVSTKTKSDNLFPQFETGDDDMLRQLARDLLSWGQNPHNGCIETLLSTILKYKPSIATIDSIYFEKIRPMLDARTTVETEEWVLAIDRIDEALAVPEGGAALLGPRLENSYNEDDKITRENIANYAQQFWQGAQAGFAVATHQLRSESNGQLVVLGTIRAETYQPFIESVGSPPSKVQSFILRLETDDRLLREIFLLNVKLMADHCFPVSGARTVKPDVQANIKFAGYQSLFSRSVFGFRESPYQFIRRHTFGTPRALMTLGGAVAQIKTSRHNDIRGATWRHPEEVIDKVTKAAVEVFEEYRDNLFPRWDTDYEKGFVLLESNVIKACRFTDADGIESRFRMLANKKSATLLEYLYGAGLAGIPRCTATGRWYQSFWVPAQELSPLPTNFEYVMLHPAFCAYLRRKIATSESAFIENSQIVVSPGDPCPSRLREPTLHLIFRYTMNSVSVSCEEQVPGEAKELFGNAESEGAAFLVVLAIAHRIYGAGHLGSNELREVAGRLATLGFIPRTFAIRPCNAITVKQSARRIGRSGRKIAEKSCAGWIDSICKHRRGKREAPAVTDAQALLDTPLRLMIDSINDGTGYRFCLFWQNAPSRRPMEHYEILVEGLSIELYLGASQSGAPM